MQTQIKRYNILLRGKVQHIGYRGIIEGVARKLDIRGYVFNDIDGSVKNSIKDFARTDIESIEKKEFDIGINLLEGIKIDTGEMKSTLGEMKSSLKRYNDDW